MTVQIDNFLYKLTFHAYKIPKNKKPKYRPNTQRRYLFLLKQQTYIDQYIWFLYISQQSQYRKMKERGRLKSLARKKKKARRWSAMEFLVKHVWAIQRGQPVVNGHAKKKRNKKKAHKEKIGFSFMAKQRSLVIWSIKINRFKV